MYVFYVKLIYFFDLHFYFAGYSIIFINFIDWWCEWCSNVESFNIRQYWSIHFSSNIQCQGITGSWSNFALGSSFRKVHFTIEKMPQINFFRV